ncbi:hypothetical protein DFJ58DRAFT_823287 [Suillus subalutaceus]|uniref:uncharacterized protein n=1 Tax=Suillus subalutaceus TaxID=48586 RepID=UPI001B878056|nr:uncharacterized protein DFJ58DRAFT_823287 [Suillus subalutaceus]KAG1832302.1 hypothetical protein DFJ58DRAFT_823287 [Suillus subalutaceus]
MPSEHLLLQAVRETTREICRVVTKMWASGLIVGTWSVWVKCRPACGIKEMCYLPTWPFGFFPPPGGADDAPPFQDSASLWPDPNKGEWKRPQPKCIRRLEPYGF